MTHPFHLIAVAVLLIAQVAMLIVVTLHLDEVEVKARSIDRNLYYLRQIACEQPGVNRYRNC